MYLHIAMHNPLFTPPLPTQEKDEDEDADSRDYSAVYTDSASFLTEDRLGGFDPEFDPDRLGFDPIELSEQDLTEALVSVIDSTSLLLEHPNSTVPALKGLIAGVRNLHDQLQVSMCVRVYVLMCVHVCVCVCICVCMYIYMWGGVFDNA